MSFSKKILTLVIITFLCAAFFSCTKDNVVEQLPPEPENDTASYYNWTVKTYNGSLKNTFVVDSNHIWLQGEYYPIFYDGNSFQTININYSDFILYQMDIVNKDIFYIAGRKDPGPSGYSALIKYSSGSQSFYRIDTLNEVSPFSMYAKNENEVWISSYHDFVYKFTNGVFEKHSLGDNIGPISTMHSNNTVYCFGAFKDSTSSKRFTNAYRYTGNGFELIRTDSISNSGLYDLFDQCGEDIIKINPSEGLYYFTGNDWIKHSNLSYTRSVGGISKDSLLAFTTDPATLYYRVLTWRGNSWRVQNNFKGIVLPYNLYYPIKNIINKMGTIYFSVNIDYGISSYSYFISGKPK